MFEKTPSLFDLMCIFYYFSDFKWHWWLYEQAAVLGLPPFKGIFLSVCLYACVRIPLTDIKWHLQLFTY